ELVLVRDALRKLGPAQPLPVEAEALAIHVIAIGDLEAHFDCAVQRARGEAERLFRLQEVLRARRAREEQQQNEDAKHQPAVSAATQSRYAGSPRSTGTAMISGSS